MGQNTLIITIVITSISLQIDLFRLGLALGFGSSRSPRYPGGPELNQAIQRSLSLFCINALPQDCNLDTRHVTINHKILETPA